jgi:hypothetical protein
MIRPLRRHKPGHWLSRNKRFTFLCDYEFRVWWVYDNDAPQYDFKNEGTGRPVAEGKTGDILGSRDAPANMGDPAESLAEAVQMAEEWVAREDHPSG